MKGPLIINGTVVVGGIGQLRCHVDKTEIRGLRLVEKVGVNIYKN